VFSCSDNAIALSIQMPSILLLVESETDLLDCCFSIATISKENNRTDSSCILLPSGGNVSSQPSGECTNLGVLVTKEDMVA